MFDPSQHITDINQVPDTWILEHYLSLGERLHGQKVLINSIFNAADKTPSMSLYVNRDTGRYRYTCFSSGQKGQPINVVMHLKGLDFGAACREVIEAYLNTGQQSASAEENILQPVVWEVTSWETRGWNRDDADFWSAYNIDSRRLAFFNVRPLAWYGMQNNDPREPRSFVTYPDMTYGYFTGDTLYKIYLPGKKPKFIKVSAYTQGLDQLQGRRFLLIGSSLKDIMAADSLEFDMDVLAPDSENVMIDHALIGRLQGEYQGIVTLFDNDAAGRRAADAYWMLYGIPTVRFLWEKDLADAVRTCGAAAAKQHLLPLLTLNFVK